MSKIIFEDNYNNKYTKAKMKYIKYVVIFVVPEVNILTNWTKFISYNFFNKKLIELLSILIYLLQAERPGVAVEKNVCRAPKGLISLKYNKTFACVNMLRYIYPAQ